MYISRCTEHLGSQIFKKGFPLWLHPNANGIFQPKKCSQKYLRRIPKIVSLALNLKVVEYSGNSIRHSSATRLAEADISPVNLCKYVK